MANFNRSGKLSLIQLIVRRVWETILSDVGYLLLPLHSLTCNMTSCCSLANLQSSAVQINIQNLELLTDSDSLFKVTVFEPCNACLGPKYYGKTGYLLRPYYPSVC